MGWVAALLVERAHTAPLSARLVWEVALAAAALIGIQAALTALLPPSLHRHRHRMQALGMAAGIALYAISSW